MNSKIGQFQKKLKAGRRSTHRRMVPLSLLDLVAMMQHLKTQVPRRQARMIRVPIVRKRLSATVQRLKKHVPKRQAPKT